MGLSKEEVTNYLAKFDVEKTLAQAVNAAVTAKAIDPVAFVGDFLLKHKQPVHRVNIVPIKPGCMKDMVKAMDSSSEFRSLLAGAKGLERVEFVALGEDKMMARSVWASADAQAQAEALVGKVLGGVMKDFVAGPPEPRFGAKVWSFKGPGDASKACWARATIIPLKPNCIRDILAVTSTAEMTAKLNALSPGFVGVDVFHTDTDFMVTYSHWTSEEAEVSTRDSMKAMFAPMAPHFAGAPTPAPGSIEWVFTPPMPRRPLSHKVCGKEFAAFEDTTFTPFVPATASDTPLPVLLFQSGYGSSSVGHQPLAQKIADAGYVVVIPDREGDNCGKESIGQFFGGLANGATGNDYNAMSTDGTHLEAALAWVKAQPGGKVGGQAVDMSQLAAGGFSMGCLEATYFAAACAEVKATLLVSPSSGEMVKVGYDFDHAELHSSVVPSFKCPSLHITSDLDASNGPANDLFAAAPSPAALLVFKDAVLDNSMALTEETSAWSSGFAEAIPGLRQHFALAAERGVVSDAPIIAFLDEHLKGKPAAPLAPEASVHELKTK